MVASAPCCVDRAHRWDRVGQVDGVGGAWPSGARSSSTPTPWCGSCRSRVSPCWRRWSSASVRRILRRRRHARPPGGGRHRVPRRRGARRPQRHRAPGRGRRDRAAHRGAARAPTTSSCSTSPCCVENEATRGGGHDRGGHRPRRSPCAAWSTHRGFEEDDARARIARQASPGAAPGPRRLRGATTTAPGSTSWPARSSACWAWIEGLAARRGSTARGPRRPAEVAVEPALGVDPRRGRPATRRAGGTWRPAARAGHPAVLGQVDPPAGLDHLAVEVVEQRGQAGAAGGDVEGQRPAPSTGNDSGPGLPGPEALEHGQERRAAGGAQVARRCGGAIASAPNGHHELPLEEPARPVDAGSSPRPCRAGGRTAGMDLQLVAPPRGRLAEPHLVERLDAQPVEQPARAPTGGAGRPARRRGRRAGRSAAVASGFVGGGEAAPA